MALFGAGCATFPGRPAPAAKTADAKAAPAPKVACEPAPRDRKPTSEPAPFLVEAFRCSMQPSLNLNVGIRIYSSLDGKETSLIYGPERMDTPPVPNDSLFYTGVKVVLAGTTEGHTLYNFQHPKLSLQIAVPRSALPTAVFDATYSDDAGANGIKGVCTRVTQVTY
ncbi:MAG: hypothetical protein JST04_05435 [Bdellovibrionales bacterium]|nr:hypothetical protein [Bdellovibrionales bacterium]